MASRDEIIAFLDELLAADQFDDYCPNGLQVPGRSQVEKVVTGVSATAEMFERSLESGADLVLCHHGIFWNGQDLALSRPQARRLQLLLANDLNLAAYHLPLDAHAEHGNNALLLNAVGFKTVATFGEHRGKTIGWIGNAPAPVARDELVERVRSFTGRDPMVFTGGPGEIGSLAVVTGAGSNFLGDAVAAGADAFLTGEPAERVMADAAEAEINFIAAGHYATEISGIVRLGELVADHFGVAHEFIELPNPI